MRPLILFLALATVIRAQAPGVPIYPEGRGARPLAAIAKAAKALRENGALLSSDKVKEQSLRTTCELTLPAPFTQKLDSRELWKRARMGHIRVGWLYLCHDCDKWHLNLAGGYAITRDAVATCTHVIALIEDMREGYLIAADDDDNLFPVAEVLAANRALDSAIVRLKTDTLTPLPLSQDVVPGDTVCCFSDPMGRRGYFSQGMVNRFVKRPFLRKGELETEHEADPKSKPKSPADKESSTVPTVYPTAEVPTWVEVSTEWAPGSSGSAVIDAFGNAVGHVSEIETVLEDPIQGAKRPAARARGTVIIFHHAITAANVLTLIKTPASK